MAARSWLLLLCLAGVLQARALPDTTGFISIDCGLPETAPSYVDDTNGLTYVSDADFIDAGSNNNISAEHITPDRQKQFLNLRCFPDGVRNCYTLRSLEAGHKYLLRAIFMYGNYDDLNQPPVFDLYIGVNFWITVNITRGPGAAQYFEVITVVSDNFAQLCLVNTGTGTPYISVLELRPIKSSLYPGANATQALFHIVGDNFGSDAIIRYPDDPFDRIWWPWVYTHGTKISTTDTVRNRDNDLFEAPSKVMQTAVTNMTSPFWTFYDIPLMLKDPSPSYMFILYFSELQLLPKNAVRQFYLNDMLSYSKAYTPEYLYSDAIYNKKPFHVIDSKYTVFLNATANSTLPPIINAAELYSVISTTEFGTDSQDVTTITAIKAKYKVQKNWMGDPCVPKAFVWDGLTCSYATSGPARITGVNMSFVGLSGDISSSFANLKVVQYLDLSHNNLSGSIPGSLSQLSSLTVLDLTGNHLSGSIPLGFLKRIQDGSLILSYGNNPDLCTNADLCHMSKGKSSQRYRTVRTALLVSVPVAVTLLMLLFFAVYICKKRKSYEHVQVASNRHENEEMGSLESLQYALSTLIAATDNFSEQNKLGQGAFGTVYRGKLHNGQEIAVKRLSATSQQGQAEMKNEVALVAKLQHKNLVRLLGYCIEKTESLLIYEFLSNKSLDKILYGPARQWELSWEQRYKIIYGIGRGLMYLHEDSRLTIIHRDLKPGNILLDADMNPKISDFGLAKLIDLSVANTRHVAGTLGYIAPEYILKGIVSAKSDVFSYGVLVLEVIIGQRPSEDLLKFVWRHWSQGNMSLLLNGCPTDEPGQQQMLRCIHIGLLCVQDDPELRPRMTSVVLMLNSHSMTLTAPTQPVFAATGERPSAAGPEPSINIVSVSDMEPR